MAKSAKVLNIDVLKEFRISMLNFAEKATNALGEADAEVQRVSMWLENEQVSHWTNEVRKRNQAVQKAKEDLRYKQIFKSPTGGKQSTVDEEKALAVAMRRLTEAEQKMANVKKWVRQLHKESHLYKGSVQRLATTVSTDLPNAAAKISRMVTSLEGYVALAAPDLGPEVQSGEGSGVSRGEAGPELTGHGRLRRNTPAGPDRDTATPADPTATAWTSGEFAANDPESLKKLEVQRQPLDLSGVVTYGPGVESAKRIYLERCSAAFPGDSGWYIGSTEGEKPTAFNSAKTEEIIKSRPHFEALFSLPVGSLVVIDGAGIGAILNGEDKDIWTGK